MSPTRQLISSTARGRFRDLTTGSTQGLHHRRISGRGFAPNPDST